MLAAITAFMLCINVQASESLFSNNKLMNIEVCVYSLSQSAIIIEVCVWMWICVCVCVCVCVCACVCNNNNNK